MHISMDRTRARDELEDTMELYLTPDQIRELGEPASQTFGWRPPQRKSNASRLRLISLPERRVIASPADVPVIEMPAIDRVISARTGQPAQR